MGRVNRRKGNNKANRARRTAARDLDLIAQDLLAATTNPPIPLPGTGPVGSGGAAASTAFSVLGDGGGGRTDGPSPLSTTPAAVTHAPVDVDLPGLGQFYCIACARHFVSGPVRDRHIAGKPHRRRVKLLAKGNFYSQAEAERAVGMAPPDNGVRRTTAATV
ncbi:hypothetical protein MMPV_007924 [Pyropia vietnamensis]